MALKFGRTAGITSRIDPETNKIMYTKEEYDASIASQEAEAQRKSDHEYSMAQFNRDNDAYYGKSTVDAKAAEAGAALLNKSNMKIGGANVTGTAAKGQSQAQSDLELQAKVNKGLYVSINDPSISDKTRELMQGANRGVDLSNAYVRTGTDATDYNKMYGYNYNPVQARKDVLSGKISSDENVGHMVKDEYGFISMGKKPVKPGPYVPGSTFTIDPNDVDPPTTTIPPVKKPKVVKKPGFEPPERFTKENKKVSMNPLAGGATSQGSGKRYLGQVGEAIGSRVSNLFKGNLNKGFGREQKLFYDTYGGGETIGQEGFGDKSLGEVRDLKKTIRKNQDLSKSDFKEGMSDLKSAIKLKKLEARGKVNFWSEAKGKEYRNSSDYEDSRADYRSQTENATNQNNIPNQQAKNEQAALGAAAANASPTSFYTTRGQMKDKFKTDNPTATPRQIRQGVRLESATNKKMLQEQAKRMEETGMLPKKGRG